MQMLMHDCRDLKMPSVNTKVSPYCTVLLCKRESLNKMFNESKMLTVVIFLYRWTQLQVG